MMAIFSSTLWIYITPQNHYLLQDLVNQPRILYNLRRYQVKELGVPVIRRLETVTYGKVSNKDSQYSKLKFIPSKSEVVNMLGAIEANKNKHRFNGVYLDGPSFNKYLTKSDLESIQKIHEIIELQERVTQEERWLERVPVSPDSSCRDVDEDALEAYKSMLSNCKDNAIFDKQFPRLLGLDLASLACSRWLTLTVIQHFVNSLNQTSVHTRTLLMQEVKEYDMALERNMTEYKAAGVTRLIIIMNTITITKVTHIASNTLQGNHWSCVMIDIPTSTWFFGDSLANPSPDSLLVRFQKLVRTICKVYNSSFQLPHATNNPLKFGHVANTMTKTGHFCTSQCTTYYPNQRENQDICGAASIIGAIILSSEAGDLLVGGNRFPHNLSWMKCIDAHAEYVRKTMVDWLVNGQIRYADLGLKVRGFL